MAPARAVIDVGTNSVKLLVARVENGTAHPLFEGSEQTRLGQGFYETHRLQPLAIEQTANVVAEFVQLASQWAPEKIRIIGTSAARDAVNKAELVQAIETAAALPLEIISGEQEADWAFQGVTSDARFSGRNLMVIDIGGGSTELILGKDSNRIFGLSFPIGTVRLLEKLPPSDPPLPSELEATREAVRNILRSLVKPAMAPCLETIHGQPLELVGTGGTTTILARMQLELSAYDRDRMDGLAISLEDVRRHRDKLWSLSLAERKKIIGLPSKRADVILPGTVIFHEIMEEFGMPRFIASTRGLRFAAVLHRD